MKRYKNIFFQILEKLWKFPIFKKTNYSFFFYIKDNETGKIFS
jgi:hypothetical protein